MLQQALSGHVRILPELLRKVTERLAHAVLLAEHVDRLARWIAEVDRACVGLLQRGDRAHQRGLAGAVRAEQPEHPGWDRQRDVVERAHAAGVALREIPNV